MKFRWILLMLTVCLAPTSPVLAQSLAQSVRVVQGNVVNADSQAQANAVVYLQDQKTLEVRTFITQTDGRYRFGQLSSDVDYQLWAEFQSKKSKNRAISSFDSKKQFIFDLKLDQNK
jgi:D-serine deaminase-like pyridoxal phosphate-dependent protein